LPHGGLGDGDALQKVFIAVSEVLDEVVEGVGPRSVAWQWRSHAPRGDPQGRSKCRSIHHLGRRGWSSRCGSGGVCRVDVQCDRSSRSQGGHDYSSRRGQQRGHVMMGVRAGTDVAIIGGKVVMSMTIGDDELGATGERSPVVIIKCFSRHHICLSPRG
jgi:hypothetical protein